MNQTSQTRDVPPVRIAVTLQKGGTGKTTTAINLAGALNHRGHDILFVDLDPQGNATEGLGLAEEYEPQKPSLFDVLASDQSLASELIVSHPEMDVLPSNIEMFQIETELTGAMRARERVSRALDAIEVEAIDGNERENGSKHGSESKYDYVIIDCPPWLGILTDSALIAAGRVVLPALAESTSTRALEILFEQIETVEQQYEMDIEELAVVANRVEPDGESEEMCAWFQETFEPHIPVVEIRKRVALKRAWSNGTSIFSAGEACDMTKRYEELAALVEDTA